MCFETPTSISPYALFVDYAVHRIINLIKHSKFVQITRKLYNVLDMYSALSEDLISWKTNHDVFHGATSDWLDSKKPNVAYIPCHEQLNPHPIAHLHKNLSHMIHLYKGAGQYHDNHDQLTSIFCRAFPQKCNPTAFLSKFRTLTTETDKPIEKKQKRTRKEKYNNKLSLAYGVHNDAIHANNIYFIEMWCLTQLGGYPTSTRFLETYKPRLFICKQWRDRYNPDYHERQKHLIASNSVVLLYVLMQFIVYAINCSGAIKTFICTDSLWPEFESIVHNMTELFRRAGRAALPLMTRFLQCMTRLGFHIKKPCDFWPFMGGHMRTLNPMFEVKKGCAIKPVLTPHDIAEIRNVSIDSMENEHTIALYLPVNNAEVKAVSRIKRTHRIKFLVYWRIIYHLMTWFRCHPDAIGACIRVLSMYYNGRCGKFTMKRFQSIMYLNYPREQQVFFHMVNSRKQSDQPYVVNLSPDMAYYQEEAVRQRFSIHNIWKIPETAQYFYFCVGCQSVKTTYIDSNDMKCSEWINKTTLCAICKQREAAGLTGTNFNPHTREISCRVKRGAKVVQHCNGAPLGRILLLGKMIFFLKSVFMYCPQINCGCVCQISSDMLRMYNYRGVSCSVCVMETIYKEYQKTEKQQLLVMKMDKREKKLLAKQALAVQAKMSKLSDMNRAKLKPLTPTQKRLFVKMHQKDHRCASVVDFDEPEPKRVKREHDEFASELKINKTKKKTPAEVVVMSDSSDDDDVVIGQDEKDELSKQGLVKVEPEELEEEQVDYHGRLSELLKIQDMLIDY